MYFYAVLHSFTKDHLKLSSCSLQLIQTLTTPNQLFLPSYSFHPSLCRFIRQFELHNSYVFVDICRLTSVSAIQLFLKYVVRNGASGGVTGYLVEPMCHCVIASRSESLQAYHSFHLKYVQIGTI